MSFYRSSFGARTARRYEKKACLDDASGLPPTPVVGSRIRGQIGCPFLGFNPLAAVRLAVRLCEGWTVWLGFFLGNLVVRDFGPIFRPSPAPSAGRRRSRGRHEELKSILGHCVREVNHLAPVRSSLNHQVGFPWIRGGVNPSAFRHNVSWPSVRVRVAGKRTTQRSDKRRRTESGVQDLAFSSE